MKKETDADQIDFNKKILHMSWHPFEDSIAIAATNNVSQVLCNSRSDPADLRYLAIRVFGIVSSCFYHFELGCYPHSQGLLHISTFLSVERSLQN